MISHLKSLLIRSLPPLRNGNDAQMRFATTERFAGMRERRYLFLTSSGPVEIALRPFHIFRAATAFMLLSVSGTWMIMTYGNNIKTAIPSIELASILSVVDRISLPAIFEQTETSVPAIADIDTADSSLAASPQLDILDTFPSQQADVPADNSRADNLVADIDQPALDNLAILTTPQTLQAQPVQPVPLPEVASNPAPKSVTPPIAVETVPEIVPAEPLDPEFVGFDGINNPPIFTDRIRFHRDYHAILAEVRIIQEIFARFNIVPAQSPPDFTGSLVPNKSDLTELYLHRDRWRQILAAVPLKPPLRYYYITSPYGWRKNKRTGQRRFHHGVDMAGTWRSELHPSTDGIVSFAGTDGGFGKVVRIQHANNIETIHAHLSEISVRKGDYVTTDTILGKMGNTGLSEGMHLHYEVRIDGKTIDPTKMFNISHQLDMLGHVPATLNF